MFSYKKLLNIRYLWFFVDTTITVNMKGKCQKDGDTLCSLVEQKKSQWAEQNKSQCAETDTQEVSP